MQIIGLMSGTSVDSIDAACVEISGAPGCFSIHLPGHLEVPWAPELRMAILDACRADAPLQEITVLNFVVAEAFAAAAMEAARSAGWDLRDVDAIASHGQTIWHQPRPLSIGGACASGTMQIGEPAVIAERTGCTVVADFRTADMAAGGQGAPLVPFADFALFAHPEEARAIQNIGGIGNVTFLPAEADLKDVIAFDTGPGNMLIDELAMQTVGKPFDPNGEISASGSVSGSLLETALAHEFFSRKPPRTTGRELFGRDAAAKMLAQGRELGLSDADTLCTATAVTAESIARAYRDFLEPVAKIDRVVLGGGGVRNATLVSMIKQALAPAPVVTHEEFGIRSDAKEAMALALLAYETLHNRPSNVPSATGAYSPAILGKIVRPYHAVDPTL